MKRVKPWATLLYYRYQRENFYFFFYYLWNLILSLFSRAFSEFIDLVNLLLVTCHLITSLNPFGSHVLRENC